MGRNFLPLESHPLVTSVASMELQDGRASIKITFKGKCTASPIRYLSPPASRRYFFRDSASSLFAQITELKLKANVGHAIPRIAAFEILGQLNFVRCFDEEVFKFFFACHRHLCRFFLPPAHASRPRESSYGVRGRFTFEAIVPMTRFRKELDTPQVIFTACHSSHSARKGKLLTEPSGKNLLGS